MVRMTLEGTSLRSELTKAFALVLLASSLDTIFSGNNGRSIDRRPSMDSFLKVVSGNITFNHLR